MATIPGSVTVFRHDDPGYLDWLATHPDGYVLNCHQRPVASYLVRHHASCTWIRPPRTKNWTSTDYI